MDFHIDTLRVESSRLDHLLDLCSGLIVNRGRILCWPSELDATLSEMDKALRKSDISAAPLEHWRNQLQKLRTSANTDAAELDAVSTQIEASVYSLRLVPMSSMLDLFPRMVHDLASELKKQVRLRVEGGSTVADKRIVEQIKAPLMHAVRNAIDHGIESPEERVRLGKPSEGEVVISVSQEAGSIHIEVHDDGAGLDFRAIREQALRQRLFSPLELDALSEAQLKLLIFHPGFTTKRMITDISGRGVGLKVVSTTVEQLHGSLAVDSVAGRGMHLHIRLPVTLTSTRVMLVREQGDLFAIAMDHIQFTTRVRAEALHTIDVQQCFYWNDQPVRIERLSLLLGLTNDKTPLQNDVNAIVVSANGERFALGVDELEGVQDVVLKPPGPPLQRVQNLQGLTVLYSGDVCPVLNLSDLHQSLHRMGAQHAPEANRQAPQRTKPVILLAEDSITTRIQEKRILETAGYEVVTAVDGLDAWNKLSSRKFDAVVSDIMMPNMSGLDLTERIRSKPSSHDLPVILVTSLSTEADRRRGLELGADAYISKPEFDQALLLDCLARLTDPGHP